MSSASQLDVEPVFLTAAAMMFSSLRCGGGRDRPNHQQRDAAGATTVETSMTSRVDLFDRMHAVAGLTSTTDLHGRLRHGHRRQAPVGRGPAGNDDGSIGQKRLRRERLRPHGPPRTAVNHGLVQAQRVRDEEPNTSAVWRSSSTSGCPARVKLTTGPGTRVAGSVERAPGAASLRGEVNRLEASTAEHPG